MKTPCLSLLLCCLFTQPLAAVSCTPLAAELTQGQLIEWQLENLEVPPQDAQGEAPRLVITQGGHSLTRRAFRYRPFTVTPGNKTDDDRYEPSAPTSWRIRHVSQQAGPISWQLLDSAGKELSQGNGTVKAAKSRGAILVAGDRTRFMYADGSAYIPIACNICWANAPDRLGKMRQYINNFAAQGGNHIRLWMASWCGQIESNEADRYRLDQAWLIDQIIEHAASKEVTINLVLDNAHDMVHGNSFPYGQDMRRRVDRFLRTPVSTQYLRRLDYVTARWAAYDNLMAWELFNELDEALIGQPKPLDMQDEAALCKRWSGAASKALRERDPYKRLITVSLAVQPWFGIFEHNTIDFAQLHTYIPPLADVDTPDKDGIGRLITARKTLGDRNKPVMFTESGYQGSNEDNPAHILDGQGLLLRQQAWAGLLIGGAGTAMNWWWDTYIDSFKLWQVYKPVADISQLLDWSDEDLTPLPLGDLGPVRLLGWQSQEQALLWPQLRADTWYRRCIDLQPASTWPAGQRTLRFTDFVTNQDFNVSVFDMTNGKRLSQQIVTSTGIGSLMVRLPKSHPDQIILIKSTGGIRLDDLD